jgi:predicted alpha/beta superfamily hydrolase
MRSRSALVSCLVLFAFPASALDRQLVTFEVVHTPSSGARDVYLLGDLPELGGGDLTRSVKLVSVDRSNWRVTVSLPVNRTYTVQYYDRFRSVPADPSNGIPFGDPVTGRTDTVALRPAGKILYAHSSLAAPLLHWRQDDGSFTALPTVDRGPARAAGERRWEAGPFGESRRPVEFFLTSGDGTQRDPADDATYATPLDAALVQDGEIFDYVPAARVSGPRREYEVTPLPGGLSTVTVYSSILAADYDIRVMLPRGYDEQRFRRYPVIYFADGGFAWEDPYTGAPFDADAGISRELTRLGAMREAIQVGVDNREFGCSYVATRSRDLVPPGETFSLGAGCAGTVTGQGDRFAAFLRDELKPWIDAQYRTLPDPAHTAFAGYSYGGLMALYLGWDFAATFGRVGSQSIGTGGGAGTAFVARVHGEPVGERALRIYLDAGGGVGDAGPADRSRIVRDDLLSKTPEPYVLERDLRYLIGGIDQHHSFAEGGARWPEMLPFLFPATEEPPACWNGVDDDGDGSADYDPDGGGDGGCVGALDPSERRNDCSDGIDNDGDGRADSDDSGCPFDFARPENPPCDDGVDDDGDGLADLDDPSCQSPHWPYWEAPPCGLGIEIALLLPLVAALRRRGSLSASAAPRRRASQCPWRARSRC